MKKVFKIGLFSMCALVACSAISSTLAWFIAKDKIDTTSRIGGEVLSGYFHSGDGSSADPFTITTPLHYENMIRLHNEFDGFAEGGFNFQFGSTDLNLATNPEAPKFYEVNSDGTVNYNASSDVLNLRGQTFTPLGTEEKPFIGKLNGNNLTVSNFNVDGNGYHDIGIFGFVGESTDTNEVKIENTYFDNFTINTKGSSITNHFHGSTPEERKHNENAHVGYLAGHIVRAETFSNVYLNNCKIDGKTTKSREINNYGYYGKVEHDITGSTMGKGDNYSFTLSSKEVYNAISNNYNSIRDNPLRARVGTEATEDEGRKYTNYTFPLDGENEFANNEAAHPVSEAITRVNNTTYRFNGTTVETNAPRNYSLSTVGYQPLTGNLRNEYEISSSDSRWTNPDNVTLDKNAASIDKQYNSGDFFRYDSSGQQWYYQHSENDGKSKRDAKLTTINLSCLNSFDLHTSTGPGKPKFDSAIAHFYLDGEEIYSSNVSCSVSLSGRYYQYRNVSINNPTFTCNISRGTHYYSFFITFKCDNNCCRYGVVYDSDSPVSLRNSNTRYYEIKQGILNYGVSEYDAGVLNFNADTAKSGEYCLSNAGPTITWDENPVRKYDGIIPTIVSPNSYEVALTGTNRINGDVSPLKESSIDKITRETITDTEYHDDGTISTTTRKVWIATDNPARAVDYSANPVYFSDAQSMIDANYKYKNIDVVGGNVSFTYIDQILFIPINLEVISLPSETENVNIVEVPLKTYIDNEKQFYATEHCPGTIVMYVNNTANALDSIDSQIGHVDFTYANMNIDGRTLINLEVPSFKKGSGTFVDIRTLGNIKEPEEGQRVNLVSTFQGDITESGAKKTSFVCLDKEGKMLGVYDADGNPGYGFFKQATNEPANERYTYNGEASSRATGKYEKSTSGNYVLDQEKVSRIDTYVIVLGCSSRNSNRSAYITEIKFNYKAHEGAGGSFGTVGYRTANETVPDTILNFYLDIDNSTDYSILVSYASKTYTITFAANGNKKININIFNYDDENYNVVFNGTTYSNTQVIEIEYSPPSS